jgi:hypothetical protein
MSSQHVAALVVATLQLVDDFGELGSPKAISVATALVGIRSLERLPTRCGLASARRSSRRVTVSSSSRGFGHGQLPPWVLGGRTRPPQPPRIWHRRRAAGRRPRAPGGSRTNVLVRFQTIEPPIRRRRSGGGSHSTWKRRRDRSEVPAQAAKRPGHGGPILPAAAPAALRPVCCGKAGSRRSPRAVRCAAGRAPRSAASDSPNVRPVPLHRFCSRNPTPAPGRPAGAAPPPLHRHVPPRSTNNFAGGDVARGSRRRAPALCPMLADG